MKQANPELTNKLLEYLRILCTGYGMRVVADSCEKARMIYLKERAKGELK